MITRTDATKVTQKQIEQMTGELVYVAIMYKDGIRVETHQGSGYSSTRIAAKKIARQIVQDAGPGAAITCSIFAGRIEADGQMYVSKSIADGFNVRYVAK